MQVSFKGIGPELISITPIKGYSSLKVSQLDIKVAASGKCKHGQALFDASLAKKKAASSRPLKNPNVSQKDYLGGVVAPAPVSAFLLFFPPLWCFFPPL
jgi:hypothetical protein